MKRISILKKEKPSYVRNDGLNVVLQEMREFKVQEISTIVFPPGAIGGNHSHPRTEIFIPLGPLTLSWIDENGEKQSEIVNPQDGQTVVVMPPNIPHAVMNHTREEVKMIELADCPQNTEEVTKAEVL